MEFARLHAGMGLTRVSLTGQMGDNVRVIAPELKNCWIWIYRNLYLGWFASALAVSSVMGAVSTPLSSTSQSNVTAAMSLVVLDAQQERELCRSNLLQIYSAVQRYRADHRDLPNWLSDLVPNYISEAKLLVCPVCLRTGRVEEPPLADPKLPSSYLFEFCPVPLGGLAPNAPTRTRREWKRRQMGLLGSEVPIIRCRHHNPVLNVSFDGRVYDSPGQWEQAFTNRINIADLSPSKCFADDPPPTPVSKPQPAPARFPARDPKARAGLLDLGKFYNATLKEPLQRRTNGTLTALSPGVKNLGGVDFDVRGVIQLGSRSITNQGFPLQVTNIPVKQKCKVLHFLHAAGSGTTKDYGTQVAAYVLRFSGSDALLEVPVVYGRDVRDWMPSGKEEPLPEGLTIAWTGTNAASTAESQVIRLFKTTWTNLIPDLEIRSIDIVSKRMDPAPMVLAITAE